MARGYSAPHVATPLDVTLSVPLMPIKRSLNRSVIAT